MTLFEVPTTEHLMLTAQQLGPTTNNSKITVEQLGEFLGHLPREFRQFHQFLAKSRSKQTAEILRYFLIERTFAFYHQIDRLFKKIQQNEKAVAHTDGILLFLLTGRTR